MFSIVGKFKKDGKRFICYQSGFIFRENVKIEKKVKADGDSKHIEVDVNRELPLQPEPIYDEVDVEGARKPVDAGILTLENMNCQVSLA